MILIENIGGEELYSFILYDMVLILLNFYVSFKRTILELAS